MSLFAGAVFHHRGGPENNPLTLMGRFPSLMGRLPTLMGRFPNALMGRFPSWKSHGKQPVKKRGIKRFLIKMVLNLSLRRWCKSRNQKPLSDRLPRGTWNDNSHTAMQNLMQLRRRLLSFWLFVSRSLHFRGRYKIQQKSSFHGCWLAIVVVWRAKFASRRRPGGEVVISQSLPLWGLGRLNWDTRNS